MFTVVMRALGLAAIVAAARAAWLHHTDNQSVILTDAVRDAFAAGQAAERTRRAEEEATARAWAFEPGADPFGWPEQVERDLGEPDLADLEKFRERFGRAPEEGPPTLAEGWTVVRDGNRVTILPPDVDGVVDPAEPEGSGWIEWGEPGQGTRG